jgi:hypothetical protein
VEAVVAGLEDMAAMGQTIEERGGHLGVAEDRGPFAEAKIGGDGDAGALVEPAQKVEEQGPARGTERQVAEFVENHEVGAHDALGGLASLSCPPARSRRGCRRTGARSGLG